MAGPIAPGVKVGVGLLLACGVITAALGVPEVLNRRKEKSAPEQQGEE